MFCRAPSVTPSLFYKLNIAALFSNAGKTPIGALKELIVCIAKLMDWCSTSSVCNQVNMVDWKKCNPFNVLGDLSDLLIALIYVINWQPHQLPPGKLSLSSVPSKVVSRRRWLAIDFAGDELWTDALRQTSTVKGSYHNVHDLIDPSPPGVPTHEFASMSAKGGWESAEVYGTKYLLGLGGTYDF
ncbi:LOW QUALITY PROTEIN: hypothetical protein CVT26_005424 [Gymnopilus dilepis]|uniref:Uncharacterized protein n=1 Tax=Gymnopilus dilepis TaxID=231916 RepID=A0A409WWV9_9AGAR|nr:LOW QUALITY PROTEIN: hypothetical protein CVT26_005424 [Gymnopilus dilepis]